MLAITLAFVCFLFFTSSTEMPVSSFKVLDESKVYHKLDHVFDNDMNTYADIFLEAEQTFSVIIELSDEILLEQVTIKMEMSNFTSHRVWAGFSDTQDVNLDKSAPLTCEPEDDSYQCHLPCKTDDQSFQVISKFIRWTIQQGSQGLWIRVYEVKIEGSRVGTQAVEEGNLVNVVWKKPFSTDDDFQQNEIFCHVRYWKILDTSPLRQIPYISSNMSVFFGRLYAIQSLVLTISIENKNHFQFRFGQNGATIVSINPAECEHLVDVGGFASFSCSLPSLGDSPLDRVVFPTRGIGKLKIIGRPIHYPTLTMSTNDVTEAGNERFFEVSCTAVSCADLPGTCTPEGQETTCSDLQLLRQNDGSNESAAVIFAQGQLTSEWADLLVDLQVMMNEANQIVVRIPKKHKFIGQYECACVSTDAAKTVVQSSPTEFERTAFSNEAIFGGKYSVEFNENRRDINSGGHHMVELPAQGSGGFFHMTAEAYSLFSEVKTKVRWVEDGLEKEQDEVYIRQQAAPLFSSVGAFSNWTVPANHLTSPDVYPDVIDNGTVVYEWIPPNESSVASVKDTFHIIDVDKKPAQRVRFWVVERTENLLHLLIYLQRNDSSGPLTNDSLSLEFVSHGCLPEALPTRIARLSLDADGVRYEVPQTATTTRLEYGFAVNLLLEDFSTSFRYEMRVTDGDNTFTPLVIEPYQDSRLKNALEDAKFGVSIVRYFSDPSSDDVRVEVKTLLVSEVLLHHLNCSKALVVMTSAWSPSEKQETTLKSADSFFVFAAPKSQPQLDFELQLIFGDSRKTFTLSAPNPYHERISMTFNNDTGLLAWTHVSRQISPAVENYQIEVMTEDVACGNVEVFEMNNFASMNCTQTHGCSTHLWNLEPFSKTKSIPTNYAISIKPRYTKFANGQTYDDGVVFGTPTLLDFTLGKTGPSILSAEKHASQPRSHTVTLLPLRNSVCEAAKPDTMDASFEIKAFALLPSGKEEMPAWDVVFSRIESSTSKLGGTYMVENLQPGRKYRLKGAIKYPGPISDTMSSEITFTTPDEILLSQSQVTMDPGESLRINCSSAVGTDPRFVKNVYWHQPHRSAVSEGVYSYTATSPDDDGFLVATLSIPQVEHRHAGIYCCSVEPPVEHFSGGSARCEEFRFVVNDLILDRYSFEANPGMAVAVTCSTNRQGELRWVRPDAAKRPLMTKASTDESGKTSNLTLLIPKVDSESVGDYHCIFQPHEGEERAPETFTLGMKDTLVLKSPPEVSSLYRFGELSTLTCKADTGSRSGDEEVTWYRYHPGEEVYEKVASTSNGLFKVIDELESTMEVTLLVRLTPSTRGSYACVVIPEHLRHLSKEKTIPMEVITREGIQYTSKDVDYKSAIDESLVVPVDGDVLLRCTGYPAFEDERLQWAFKEEGAEDTYGIGDTTPEASSLADKERVTRLLNCFRSNLNKSVASWPRSDSLDDFYSTDLIELPVLPEFMKSPACRDGRGHLLCQYRRPSIFKASISPEFALRSRHISASSSSDSAVSMDAIRRVLSEMPIRATSDQFRLGSTTTSAATTSNQSPIVGFFMVFITLLLRLLSVY